MGCGPCLLPILDNQIHSRNKHHQLKYILPFVIRINIIYLRWLLVIALLMNIFCLPFIKSPIKTVRAYDPLYSRKYNIRDCNDVRRTIQQLNDKPHGCRNLTKTNLIVLDCFATDWTSVSLELEEADASIRGSRLVHISLHLYHIDFSSSEWSSSEFIWLPRTVVHLIIGNCDNLNLDRFRTKPKESNEELSNVIDQKSLFSAVLVRTLIVCSTNLNMDHPVRTWDIILAEKYFLLASLVLASLKPKPRFTNNKWRLRNKRLRHVELDDLGLRQLSDRMITIDTHALDGQKWGEVSLNFRGNPIEHIEQSFVEFGPAFDPDTRFHLKLDLSNCTLDKTKLTWPTLQWSTYAYVGTLDLDLSANYFVAIDQELFEPILEHAVALTKLKVRLYENPIDCYSCLNHWIVQDHRRLKRHLYGIQCPPEDIEFDKVSPDDLPENCHSPQSIVLTFLFILISFLVAVVILMTMFTLIAFFCFGVAGLPWRGSSVVSSSPPPIRTHRHQQGAAAALPFPMNLIRGHKMTGQPLPAVQTLPEAPASTPIPTPAPATPKPPVSPPPIVATQTPIALPPSSHSITGKERASGEISQILPYTTERTQQTGSPGMPILGSKSFVPLKSAHSISHKRKGADANVTVSPIRSTLSTVSGGSPSVSSVMDSSLGSPQISAISERIPDTTGKGSPQPLQTGWSAKSHPTVRTGLSSMLDLAGNIYIPPEPKTSKGHKNVKPK